MFPVPEREREAYAHLAAVQLAPRVKYYASLGQDSLVQSFVKILRGPPKILCSSGTGRVLGR